MYSIGNTANNIMLKKIQIRAPKGEIKIHNMKGILIYITSFVGCRSTKLRRYFTVVKVYIKKRSVQNKESRNSFQNIRKNNRKLKPVKVESKQFKINQLK